MARTLRSTCAVCLQAIAALNKAMAADPNNAEVLLSLGVSYTNELDQGRALNFLTAWLSRQPAFTKVCPLCLSSGLCFGLEDQAL